MFIRSGIFNYQTGIVLILLRSKFYNIRMENYITNFYNKVLSS